MSDTVFRALVAAVTLAAAALVVRVSFCRAVDMPAIPPPPAPKRVEAAQVTAAVDRDPQMYARKLAEDSRALRVTPPATPAELSRVLPHQVSSDRIVLAPRGKESAEVLGLRLALSVADIEGTPRRQMILTIANTTDQFLAYRILTRPSRGTSACHEKADIAHNAVALAPGETVRRSECIYKSGWRLVVDRVETAALPALSYYYVSAVPPPALGLDLLPSRGHRPPAGRSPCQIFQPATLTEAIRSGETRWRDLVDFYARHPCQTFTFPVGYKAFERDGERPLPVVQGAP